MAFRGIVSPQDVTTHQAVPVVPTGGRCCLTITISKIGRPFGSTTSRGFIGMLLLALVLGGASLAGAQTGTFGSIQGQVTDESGAAIPGATLTLTSPALQVPQRVETSDAE